MDTDAIATRLTEIRKARGWTLKRIADEIGSEANTVCRHFQTGKMTTDYLIKYAEALGCTIADITDGVIDLKKFVLKDDITSYWPYNLALAVAGGEDEKFFNIYVPGILESLTELTEREQEVLKMRFMSGMTLDECAAVMSVGRERIRQIEAKALRKLRHPMRFKRWHLDTMDKAIEEAKERSRLELENAVLRSKLKSLEVPEEEFMNLPESARLPKPTDVDIGEMELSVRSYNCLKRAMINNISDLEGMTVDDLMKVRNLGRKSMEEVIAKAKEWGIEIGAAPEKT